VVVVFVVGIAGTLDGGEVGVVCVVCVVGVSLGVVGAGVAAEAEVGTAGGAAEVDPVVEARRL
jgi:hypothetical protein